MITTIFETTGGFLTVDDYHDIIMQQGVIVGRSSVYRAVKLAKGKVGHLRVVPLLTFKHKAARLDWSRTQLEKPVADRWGNDNDVRVFLDEKWFYIAPVKRQWVELNGKKSLVSLKTKCKTQMTKVMFLCAVARPNPAKDFNGLICCLPIVEERAAKRNSKYHTKGEMRLDPLNLNFEKFFAFLTDEGGLIDKTLEAVGRWAKRILFQMDQAGGHGGGRETTRDDKGMNRTTNALRKWATSEKGRAMMRKHGFDGELEFEAQPSLSPDFNLLDLGFWRVLETVAARIQRNYLFAELRDSDKVATSADGSAAAKEPSVPRTAVGDQALENAMKIAKRWRESEAKTRMADAQKKSQKRRSGDLPQPVDDASQSRKDARLDSAFVSIVKDVTIAFTVVNPSTIESLCQVMNVVLDECVQRDGDNSKTSFHSGVKREEARLAAVRAKWPDYKVPPPPLTPEAQGLLDEHVKDLEQSHPERITKFELSLDHLGADDNADSGENDGWGLPAEIEEDRASALSWLLNFFMA